MNPFHSFKQKCRRDHPYERNVTKCNDEFDTSVSIIIFLIFWPLDVRWEIMFEIIECIIWLTDSWVTFNAIKERAKLDKSVKRWDASDKIAIELERNPPISSAMKNTKHTDSDFQKTSKYVLITSFLYYVIMILVTTKHLEKVPSEAMVSLLVAFCFV